jgi:TPP-dependent pyruvate/acetoin dehydrogenase alpha subunit
MPKKTIDLGEIDDLRILDEEGRADAALDPALPADDLKRLHRAMVLTRKLDLRMLNMQRTGEMGTFAPGLGQEATQIGQVWPLTKEDWFAPSYRSFGAQLWRGWTIEGLMLLWDGYFKGFEIPEGVHDLPFSIVIGSHVPLAVGVGMGMTYRGEERCVVTNFGDGALSQGAVNESLNFAAVFKAPVVLVCENNGWAISVPVAKQAATPRLAVRGPGFGLPGIRVDGNDILAMIVACSAAAERARSGAGPTFIEAVTYRMSLHTTADDPKVYRPDEDVEGWKAKCPIARFEKYLGARGVMSRPQIDEVSQECEEEVIRGRDRFRELAQADPHEIFDYMYHELPAELEAQKREYFERLKRKGIDGT